jgi:Spy/CpxP family protein refolding chaperone
MASGLHLPFAGKTSLAYHKSFDYTSTQMGWFGNLSANQKINQKIQDVEEDLGKAKRQLRELDLEFSSLYGKVRTALSRIEKRYARMEASEAQEEEVPAAGVETPPDGLTPQQRQWNNRILAARAARGSGG